MGIKLEKEYLKRYKDLGALLLKYGNSDLVKNAGLSEALNGDGQKSAEVQGQAEELTKDLESLGPAFVKVGQLLSTRADFLPTTYMEALSRLQDNCEPFPFAEVEKIVTNELGVRMSKAFQDFQSEPLAAASLGQIHRATMRNGRAVAVKIQRPDIREQVVRDLDVLSDVAQFYDTHTKTGKRYEFARMLEEFRKTILDELDYRKEAQNLTTIKENLKKGSSFNEGDVIIAEIVYKESLLTDQPRLQQQQSADHELRVRQKGHVHFEAGIVRSKWTGTCRAVI